MTVEWCERCRWRAHCPVFDWETEPWIPEGARVMGIDDWYAGMVGSTTADSDLDYSRVQFDEGPEWEVYTPNLIRLGASDHVDPNVVACFVRMQARAEQDASQGRLDERSFN